MAKKLSYHSSVDYSIADPAKILAQQQGKLTANNFPFGFNEVADSRGESAYVFDMGSMYGALVQEGLGTKGLIAQEIYDSTGKSYFANIAQDSVAAIINDLISVGATPVVLNAYWSSNSYNWLSDKKLAKDFITGWKLACDTAGVVWGGGETQSLPGIIKNGAIEIAGSAFGVIKPKSRLLSGRKIKHGDAILILESNGVHANGISLARDIAKKLKGGYQTKLSDGTTFGETLLAPTNIYAKVLQAFFKQKLAVHYVSNITGHGWRKIMRANRDLTYSIEKIPQTQSIFDFIQKHSGLGDKDMYGTYNIGAGLGVFLPQKDAHQAQSIAKELGINGLVAGRVETGPRQVIIKPKDIIFRSESLALRS